MKLEEIHEYVEKHLSEKRYYHSKCVMERCKEIAGKFGVDIETAQKVGIAHDIAKELPEDEKLEYCRKNNIEVDEIEKANPTLLHAKIGADMAKKYFEFDDSMARAIRAHTTGLPNMDMLAKVLFISDRTSKERNLPDIDYINELLEKGIDEAMLYILDEKIKLQLKKKNIMHVDTVITRNYLLGEK